MRRHRDIFRESAVTMFAQDPHGFAERLIAGETIAAFAAKAAVNNLAQTAANAFAGTGVRVNAVLPGLVETQLTRKVFEDARARGVEGKLGHVTPMKRPGRADEIAAAAAFLASDDSSYVDGQLLSVDGGVSSTHPYGRIAL